MIENQKIDLDICSPVKSLLSTQNIPIRFRCKWPWSWTIYWDWKMRGLRSNISVMWADTAFIVRPSWKLWTSLRRVNAVNVSLARLQLAAWCSNKCDLDPYLTRLLGNGRAVMFHLSNIIKLWTRSSYNFLALSLWLLSRHTQGISTGVPYFTLIYVK